jgi:hypothetical protein
MGRLGKDEGGRMNDEYVATRRSRQAEAVCFASWMKIIQPIKINSPTRWLFGLYNIKVFR